MNATGGSRAALVLVPGIQGRWEYMQPAVEALSRDFRVLTVSLCAGTTFEEYVAQITNLLDAHGVERAVICGISFGGAIAVRMAAAHPERTDALILASTPPPVFRLRKRHETYLRLPWLFGPVFMIETPWRLRTEIAAALPGRRERWRFRAGVLRTLGRYGLSFSSMAARARLLTSSDLRADCRRISAPTLVVTGERHLDYVVPVEGSSEYARLIPGAREVVLPGTGHIGAITKPHAFAAVVKQFVEGTRDAAA